MDFNVLEQYGIDYRSGLSRCMDDAEFYEELLASFLNDKAFEHAKEAYERKDQTAMFEYAHEMKGACGNADLKELYEAVCPLVELLRRGSADETLVDAAFQRLEAAYLRARKGVVLACGLQTE